VLGYPRLPDLQSVGGVQAARHCIWGQRQLWAFGDRWVFILLVACAFVRLGSATIRCARQVPLKNDMFYLEVFAVLRIFRDTGQHSHALSDC